MRTGVGKRHQAVRVAQHLADGGFVGVEEQRAEDRVEVLFQR